MLADGKEARTIDGRDHVLEYPIRADVAIIKAAKADRWGNLIYRKTARNFGPVMAMAAACTIAQVDVVVELGALDPESIVTPGHLRAPGGGRMNRRAGRATRWRRASRATSPKART